ncbi:MAG: NYN domain-containing protein [Nocardioides sp.]|uniref:NYN domain-containing protein n=1 Tax=Nocardioides sp. TaxID=35761 RepID=UPI0032669ED2
MKGIEMPTNLAAVLPLTKQHTFAPRRQIILVDIENVVGGAVLTAAAANWARTQIENVLALNCDTQVIIGTSHVGYLETALAWPNKQYAVNSGPDGADLALIDEIDALRLERYDEIILVSGDGIFAEAVATLTGRGVDVTVVAHYGQCAGRLLMAASRTIYLQPDHNDGIASGVA